MAECRLLCDLVMLQVSSRLEIGVMRTKEGDDGHGAGALMLPETFVQKVKAHKGVYG